MQVSGPATSLKEPGPKAIAAPQTPLGPSCPFPTTEDLLDWMGRQFDHHGDIFKASMYGSEAYVTRDIDFAAHVLVNNWKNYVKGHFIKRIAFLLGNGLMVSEGELWKRQRRMVQPAFDHRLVGSLIKMMVMVNSALLTKWQIAAKRGESVNVTRDVSAMALEVVLRFILGEDYEEIGSRFDLVSEETGRNLAFAQSFRSLGKVILQVAARRRQEASQFPDALNMLLQARDPSSGQRMHDHQLVNEILTLIVAGHETTASTLNWTWYLISQHPEAEAALANELRTITSVPELEDLAKFSYARQIIDESMRLYPAGWLMTRRALHDDRLGDYFVPAGTEIYISPYFIQRHPNVWADPERFDPGRFVNGNPKHRHRLAAIPFSAGPRNCIGALFARVEMQIHLMTVAKHLRLRYVQARPIELDAGVNLRSKYDFIMYPELTAA